MLVVCLVFVTADDLPPTPSYSQQTLNIGNFAPNSYASNAYDEQNAYTAQNAEYQIPNHNAAGQGQFDVNSIDLTDNRLHSNDDGHQIQSNGFHGGISNSDIEQHQSNAFDESHDYYNSHQPIHTQAETFPISKHVEFTRNVPYPVYKQIHVPGSFSLYVRF